MEMETPEPRHLTPEEEWQITCHEAGHAVVGLRLQVPFLYVERGVGEHGQVDVGVVGPLENSTREPSQDEISGWQQFYAGGAAAEKLLFGNYREYACRWDQGIHEKLEKRRRPNRSGGWHQDVHSAMNLLDRESVEKVAKELDRHRKLDEEQVYKIFGLVPSWY